MASRRTFIEAALFGGTMSTLASVSMNAQVRQNQIRRRVLVFDVNETMLDVGALRCHDARTFLLATLDFGRSTERGERTADAILHATVSRIG
jgi:hypothetical protein